MNVGGKEYGDGSADVRVSHGFFAVDRRRSSL